MAKIPALDRPGGVIRPWWMLPVVTGQTTNARLQLAHLGAIPRGAIVLSLANYAADTVSTADTHPGAGKLRWNHVTQASATEIYIADVDSDADDHSALWSSLVTGGYVYAYNPDDLDVWQHYQITGVTDGGGYLKLAVILQASGDVFGDADPVVLTIQQPSPSPGVDRNIVTAVTSSGGLATVDASLGDYFTLVLAENTTLAIAAAPAAATLHIAVTQSSPAHMLTTPGNWNAGAGVTLPTMPTGAGDVLDLIVTTNNSGGIWIASGRVRA